jgi:DNA-binding MarR family transcriptional regulator
VAPTPESPVDPELVGQLRVAVGRLARMLRRQDTGDLSPSLRAALLTIGREGPLTLGDLAAAEHMSPPSVTSIVNRLEEAGLVKRTRDRHDLRVWRVDLSAHGRRQLQINQTRRSIWLMARIADLSPENRARFVDAVAVLEELTAPPDGSDDAQPAMRQTRR